MLTEAKGVLDQEKTKRRIVCLIFGPWRMGSPVDDCASGHKVISGLRPGGLQLLCGLADHRVLCILLRHWSLLEAGSQIPNLLWHGKCCIFYDSF